ncbi:hypothetical protein DW1_2936 [Proteiniborus sp. DW1]|uniref:hypothetical protein n=1 Tax=Proteiniborus sp. DW1 TaxID=1889883 RepID=UPI00092E1D67|nr:hypothetical protein [Proteiniborus sp. DW1]SCG84491.1 hypothetical protein DW1_2936 [Proteiniborus sp. DW1]
MKEEIRNILTRLENGEIDCKKAVKLIKNINENAISKVKPAKKLKIEIIDGDDDRKIRLPGIPFWLLSSLSKLGLSVAPLAAKHNKGMDENSMMALDLLKDVDISEFIKALKAHGPFDFIDVCSDKDVVKISVL